MGLTFMLKDGKLSYTLLKEKCGEIIKLKDPKSVKDCISVCGMVNILSFSLKDFRKHLISSYKLQSEKKCFSKQKNVTNHFNIWNKY